MGTRNLTIVVHKGQHKIAQYGQWDGYPEGQGRTVLAFCRRLRTKEGRARFVRALEKVRTLSQEEVDKMYESVGVTGEWVDAKQQGEFHKLAPHMTRDLGGEILAEVMSAEGPVLLRDETSFAADSLFCEWAYVVDLDNRKLEVYKGFNRSPLPPADRFANLAKEAEGLRKGNEYYPVRCVKKYALGNLPTFRQFLKDLRPIEAEE